MRSSRFSTILSTVFLSASLTFGGTVSAQDSTTETTETDNTQTEASETVQKLEDQLSLGEDANANPAVGDTYTKVTNGAFEMRCLRTETPENDPCQMYQLMQDQNGSPVAEFSMFRLPGDGQAKAGATVIVPLETSLTAQLTVTVDSSKARRYPFAFCNQVGCYARIGFTEADVAAFKAGNEAKLTIVPAYAPDQKVELLLSLKGFTKSYAEVSVVNQ